MGLSLFLALPDLFRVVHHPDIALEMAPGLQPAPFFRLAVVVGNAQSLSLLRPVDIRRLSAVVVLQHAHVDVEPVQPRTVGHQLREELPLLMRRKLVDDTIWRGHLQPLEIGKEMQVVVNEAPQRVMA